MRNLCSLVIDTSQYGPVLISVVMSKLPEDMKFQISWSMPLSHEWDVSELLAASLKEIKSREMCSFMNCLRKDNKYRGSCEPDNFTGAAFVSGSNQSGQSFTIKCTYCRKSDLILDHEKPFLEQSLNVLFDYMGTIK